MEIKGVCVAYVNASQPKQKTAAEETVDIRQLAGRYGSSELDRNV
jgi:hypothetical protein